MYFPLWLFFLENYRLTKSSVYLLASVMGVLVILSVLMVSHAFSPLDFSHTPKPQLTFPRKIGVAWLCGARFDVAINELRSGSFAKPSDAGAVQSIISKYDHGEL